MKTATPAHLRRRAGGVRRRLPATAERLPRRGPDAGAPSDRGPAQRPSRSRVAPSRFPAVPEEPGVGNALIEARGQPFSPAADRGQGGAADLAARLPERAGLRPIQRPGGPGRMDAGPPEDLVG